MTGPLLPEFAQEHCLAIIPEITVDPLDNPDEYEDPHLPTDDMAAADVVTSATKDGRAHRPFLDIDFRAELIPSTTPGHFHLYLDKEMSWPKYRRLLNVLAEVGILERGYVNASIDREYTSVRLPWVKKPEPKPQPEPGIPDTYPPNMPRGSWLWPDDRTGMEWADKHDERL